MQIECRRLRIALAGGGSERDSAPVDRYFSDWLEPGSRLLYIPIALGTTNDGYAKAGQWLRRVFEPLGVGYVDVWTDLDSYRPYDISNFDGLYLGGGNTFLLLYELRRSGLAEVIRRCARQDLPVYGGSAGAVVLGRDIMTVHHLDPNTAPLTDTTGLDLALGCSVWVHYEDAHRSLIEEYQRNHGGRSVVLSERSAVAIEEGQVYSVGSAPAYLVDGTQWQILGDTADQQ